MSFSGLGGRLRTVFERGLKSGAVKFTESTTVPVAEAGLEFLVKFAPALGQKPSKPKSASTEPPPDPFAPPYDPDLLVQDGVEVESEPFVLLLNKFCVEPRHFLLVTRDFEPQQRLLSPAQLLATHRILAELNSSGTPTLAFYNCGSESGASQPHKHIQFISPADGEPPIVAAIARHRPAQSREGEVFSLPTSVLPVANYVAPLSSAADPSTLTSAFTALLDAMVDDFRRRDGDRAPPKRLSEASFNLLVHSSWMLLAPRSRETFERDGERISVNALAFAGMLLVKSDAQLELVKRMGVGEVVRAIGWPAQGASD